MLRANPNIKHANKDGSIDQFPKINAAIDK